MISQPTNPRLASDLQTVALSEKNADNVMAGLGWWVALSFFRRTLCGTKLSPLKLLAGMTLLPVFILLGVSTHFFNQEQRYANLERF